MKYNYRKIFDFNLFERDCWVKEQASLIKPGARVLDVGAGSCPYRQYFQHCDYETQDFASLPANQLRGMEGYGDLNYVSDILSLPVPSASFDVILCTEVLEHVPEPIKAIHEFARILKPGGTLLLTIPLGSGLHQEPYHYYGGYTPHWFNKYLPEDGFSLKAIVPNGGFFKHFGQESRRFSRILTKGSGSSRTPWFISIFGLISYPFFSIMFPAACHLLDKYDGKKDFTVGYFVKAEKDDRPLNNHVRI